MRGLLRRVVDLQGAVPTLIDRIRKRVDRYFRYRIQSQDQRIRTANEIIAAAGEVINFT
jgi:hypothetical protein